MNSPEEMPRIDGADLPLPKRVDEDAPPHGGKNTLPPAAPDSDAQTPPISLADHLEQNDIHPVLVVGTNSSGKTTMLQSLIYFMRLNRDHAVDIRLGDRVFPPNYPDGDQRHDSAVKFYNFDLEQFGKKVAATPTAEERPFFVPIDLLVSENGVTNIYKFAFYEGRGEWFEKVGPANSYRFREFQSEFAEIVTKFANPLSIMFLAPAVDSGPGPRQSRQFAHSCLENAITEFHRHRVNSNRDHALLLLTRWDQKCKPSDANGHFTDADPDFVTELMKKWEFMWPKFAGVKLDGPRAKSIMPYSACRMNEKKEIISVEQEYKHIFDKYNRTIWNWLYMNIVDVKRNRQKFTKLYIYEDVLRAQEARHSFWWNLTKAVLRA